MLQLQKDDKTVTFYLNTIIATAIAIIMLRFYSASRIYRICLWWL